MRQLSWALIGMAGLMASGLQSAQAGMTCKIVPGWCPAPEHQVTTTASTNTNNTSKTELETPSFDRGGSNNQGSNNPGWNPGSDHPGSDHSDHHDDHGPTSVPEPATLLLLGAGVSAVGAATLRRRKRK